MGWAGAGSGSYRLGIGACDMHGLADCNNTAEPFLYSCYMRPCVVCIKLRMERLHFYQIQKHEKNKHMFCSNFSARISRNFYQNVLSSARQLQTWKNHTKKKKYNLSGWKVHRLVMIVIKNSPENQMKKHVLWIKKRKLYISAFGACSYNDTDMLCDFMREKKRIGGNPHDS